MMNELNEQMQDFLRQYQANQMVSQSQVEEPASGYSLTHDQQEAVFHFQSFLKEEVPAFVLTGAAGTGKTTLLRELVKVAEAARLKLILLAPTGRAAKVAAVRSGLPSSTIHRHIYSVSEEVDKKSGALKSLSFSLKKAKKNEATLFVVDEASMLPGSGRQDGLFKQNSLLEDLFQFVQGGHPSNRLLFVGDPYQLPPVGEQVSPALSPEILESEFKVETRSAELKEVLRQASGSALLQNAMALREAMWSIEPELPELHWDSPECQIIYGVDEAVTAFCKCYLEAPEETIFLCLSNQQAANVNQKIRQRLFPEAGALPFPGEQLMVVKNHYFRLEEQLGFIANGEMIKVEKVHEQSLDTMAGFNFLLMDIIAQDEENRPFPYRSKIITDLLFSASANVSGPQYSELYQLRRKTLGRNFDAVTDPFLNALQMKFGYAVTCHKAQGGEWKNVFVLQEFSRMELREKLRWDYTAITRASENLFLVKQGRNRN